MSKKSDRKSGRSRFSEEEKQVIVEEVARLGFTTVRRKYGIPDGTLGGWLRKFRSASRSAVSETPNSDESARDVDSGPGAESSGEKVPQAARTGKRRVARSYTPSQRAEILEYTSEHGVTAAAKKFGVSAWSVHDWHRKVEKAAQGQGADPTSGPDAMSIEEQRDREILSEWKRHPGLGPSQIKNQLMGVVPIKALLRRTQVGFVTTSARISLPPIEEPRETLQIERPIGDEAWPTSASLRAQIVERANGCSIRWVSGPTTYEYDFVAGELWRAAARIDSAMSAPAAIELRFSAPLPDLRRAFAGVVSRRFLMLVNGLCHGYGKMNATTTPDGAELSIRPIAPSWFRTRPMSSRLTLASDDLLLRSERVGV